MSKNNLGGALIMEMGTGKTLVAVSLANLVQRDVFSKKKRNARVLVLCPLAVVGVWPAEFKKISEQEFNVSTLKKLDKKGNELITKADNYEKADALERELSTGKPTVIVVNYESAKRNPLARVILRQEWDLIIADEMHKFKGVNTAVTDFMLQLSEVAERRIGLTGTEMPHSPLDVWSQMAFLNAEVLGSRPNAFKNKYCVYGGFGGKAIVGWKNEPELRDKIDSIAFRAKKSELLDLPSLTEQVIYCSLSGQAKKVHDEISRKGRTALANPGGDPPNVLAINALTRMLRAQQATSGFVGGVSREGQEKTLERIPGSGKLEVLKELIEDALGEPVVVFCRFKEELKIIKELADKLKLVYGEISGSDKSGLLRDSPKMRPEIQILGVQIDSGGTGIDLTHSNIGIYYSKTHNFGNYDQSRSRQHRSGQTSPVILYSLVCKGSVDEDLEEALSSKEDLAGWYKKQEDKKWG